MVRSKKELASTLALALIWQGHVLDLMDRRDEAVAVYEKAAALNVEGEAMHGQFGLRYEYTSYALKRTKSPFKRIENQMRD
jgi:hypothetical protein